MKCSLKAGKCDEREPNEPFRNHMRPNELAHLFRESETTKVDLSNLLVGCSTNTGPVGHEILCVRVREKLADIMEESPGDGSLIGTCPNNV